MKRLWIVLVSLFVFAAVQAQDQEIEQLILNVEKLSQFKQILADMKSGYDIVSKGYSAIRDISQGNFNLHKLFLDGLLAVSPAVKNYYKVAEIVSDELRLVKEYKAAYNRFKGSGLLHPDELDYLFKVYSKLVNASLKCIGDLTTVITAYQLRMSDEERLTAIDHIHADMKDQLLFLRYFNNQNSVLLLQRTKDADDIKSVRTFIK